MTPVIVFVICFVLGWVFSRQILIALGCAVVLTVATVVFLAWDHESDREQDEAQRGEPRTAVPTSLVGVWEGAPSGRSNEQLRITVAEGGIGAVVAVIRTTRQDTECVETATLEQAYDNRIVVKPSRMDGTQKSCAEFREVYRLTFEDNERVKFEGAGSTEGRLSRAKPVSRQILDVSAIVGTWRGTYICRQGETGLTLTIASLGGNKLKATFEFYPVPSNPSAPRGSSSKLGVYHDGHITLLPDRWIDRPKDTVMVGLSADVDGIAPNVMTGKVLSRSCTEFTITKQN